MGKACCQAVSRIAARRRRSLQAEAYVPLFAITSVPEFEQRLEKGAAHGFGRFSHFEVFPTLLLAMGYDAGWVKRTYGPSLMDSPSPDRKFMIGSSQSCNP